MTSLPSEPHVLVVEGIVSDRVLRAASWLADQPTPPVPLVPELRRRFDLTAKDACEVCALAGKMRILRGAFA